MRPWIGLSLMLEDDFRNAALPLFAEGTVDVLEWSFDTGWGRTIPEWADALLDHYGEEGRLLGHGVHYSAFSARWEDRQARWLELLAGEVSRRRYVHVSEHYGFMTAEPFMRGAPLPVPRGEPAVRVGRDRLDRMRAVLSKANGGACPIGLENLALAWNREEALAHGAFLDEVLEREDDFVILDVHNLYCQIENFDLDPDELLATYPVSRVREIHVSGGSFLPAWPRAPNETVRCDTHDDDVPEPVFDLLRRALVRFPNVRAVILERLGGTLRTAADAEGFGRDYLRVRHIVDDAERSRAAEGRGGLDGESAARMSETIAPRNRTGSSVDRDDETLARYQSALLLLLKEDLSEAEVRERLEKDPAFEPFRAEVRAIDSRALGIAARVVKKWARRDPKH